MEGGRVTYETAASVSDQLTVSRWSILRCAGHESSRAAHGVLPGRLK